MTFLKVTSNGNLKQAWVNGGRGCDSLKVARWKFKHTLLLLSCDSETIWRGLRAALPVPRVRLPAGDEQRGLARDAEVRHSGARSHRLRAETSAARPRRALRHLSIHFFPVSCLFLCYTPITSPSAAEAAQRLRLDEEQEEHGQERLAL